MSRCAMCGKPIATNTVTSSTVKQLLNGGPNATYGNESQFCTCPSAVSTLPISMWTEEQLRAFVAQEVAKALHALKQPPIFTFKGNEQALREYIAKGGYPQLMFPEDAVSEFQEVPAEEVMQTFEEIEPESKPTPQQGQAQP